MQDLPPPQHIEESVPVEVQKPGKEEIIAFADHICETLKDGFQVADIGPIVKASIGYLEHYKGLSQAEKKEDIVTILCYVIDQTDTPYLPDLFTDPIFKAAVSPLIDLTFAAFAGELNASDLSETVDTLPTDDQLRRFAEEISVTFDDGFQLHDLSTIVRLGIEYVEQFTALTEEEKRADIIQIVSYVIDITDMPYVPDRFVDPIVKAMLPPFVEFIIAIRDGRSGALEL